tara:strand:- start:378 stop:515 length:138 start_codon:yes stop_codon:yes gene_type:complete
MAKRAIIYHKIEKPKVRRPGTHAKSKTSRLKSSKNYVKPYNRQGR